MNKRAMGFIYQTFHAVGHTPFKMAGFCKVKQMKLRFYDTKL